MKLEVIRDRTTLRFIAEESRVPPAAPTGVREHALRLVERIKAWRRAWAERSRELAMRRALAGLDDVTLRDLGIRRSEFGSIEAESLGRAELTRARLVRANGELFGDPRAAAKTDYYR